ncbi:MAG TPA: double-strand break repair protein AddB [Devosia sp.]|nr:double-strand break repair protein AddB [Devosia sp.]
MSRRGIYSIGPHARFLERFADAVLDGPLLNGWRREGPFWLSDVTIILPTRRSRLALAEIFAARLGGAALLPDIRTLGGEAEDEEPFLPPIDAPAPKPVMAGLERRIILSRLIAAYAQSAQGMAGFASPPNAAEQLWLADSLSELIDDLETAEISADALGTIAADDLAENWQSILRFLDLALKAWPAILEERGKVDAAAARNERLKRQAATTALLYGDRPVIAAGSTGSVPATAMLLDAILKLERGAIVLPGLDTTLTPQQHEGLLAEGETTHGHPQYGLAQLLKRLGAGIADVEELAPPVAPRTALLHGALAAADETPDWLPRREGIALDDALKGVSIVAAPNPDVEARAVALAARAAIASQKSVGIVTRDQTLARRIAAELARYGLEPDDPAGTPLFQSSAGRLARQILAVAVSKFAPLDLIALLSNRAVTLSLDRSTIWQLSKRIDRRLRGERTGVGLDGVRALLGDGEPAIAAREMLNRLEARIAPVTALMPEARIMPSMLAGALRQAMDALIGKAELYGLPEFEAWANELAAMPNEGAGFPPVNLDGVLAALMDDAKVRSVERRRDDIHIWGELEARLMNPDVMILAGLNEDVWPAPAAPGPWMSRSMRLAVGLEPPERRQGQAAHDFLMAAGNGEVILAFANRVGGSPSLPSRFLQRLEAFVGLKPAEELRTRGARWLADAVALDRAGTVRPAPRPEPRPPASDRPRRISVTEVETLVRSPYDIYARHVLKLRKLEPLGSEPSARERGNMIHKVFETFVAKGLSFRAPEARGQMLEMAREAFKGLDAVGERRDIWLKRFERAADLFLEWERERHGGIAARAAESKGLWELPLAGGFILSGKADRIDQRTDGLLEILDFKTGGVPAAKDMREFDAPQLLLEAAMARAGAFPGIQPRDTAALTYIKIGLGPAAFQIMPFRLRKNMSLMDAVEEIARRTQGHIEAFLIRDSLTMSARIRPRIETGRKPRPGDYDHLARTDEWTLTSGVDDP